MKNPNRPPGFQQALLTLAAIIAVIATGLFHLQTSLHSLMLICLLIASISAWRLGYGFSNIREAMNAGISGALSAIYIFILIGVLIAALIESGTLATLIYYGIQFIHPAFFLPAGLLLCSFMSLATGTSWGTVGTIGVVLVSIGSAMGIPVEIVAGMIISGACFGDKMSPMSDTTNLSAMTAGTDLYSHIRSMLCTTGPTYILTLILFTLVGLGFLGQELPAGELTALTTTLDNAFTIHPLTLLPLVAMLLLSLRRAPAEPAMMAAAVTAVLLAVLLQGRDFTQVLNSLYGGGSIRTGLESLDSLLARGGITSMMWTLSLSLMALALGGILEKFGFLRVLISVVIVRVKTVGSLVATTIVACFMGNMTMGEAYMSIILGGQLFGGAYDDKGIDRPVMSRSLEEGATLTTALIPWTTGGAFFASTLGVAVLDYAPWALLNWMNPLLSIAFAYLGIALFKSKDRRTLVAGNIEKEVQA